MKRCTKCSEEKDESEFSMGTYVRKADGVRALRSQCKVCVAAVIKDYKNRHIEITRQHNRENYARNGKNWKQTRVDYRNSQDVETKRAYVRKSYKKNRTNPHSIRHIARNTLKKSLGFVPPEVLVEVKSLQYAIARIIKESTK